VSLFRSPKGVYTRGTNDWFQSSAATACGIVQTGTNGFKVLYLYNNDQRGRLLSVYSITASLDEDQGFAVGLINSFTGTQETAPFGCFPINPLLPAPSGQVFGDTINFSGGQLIAITSSAFNDFSLSNQNNAPLVLIPPGWSLFAANLAPTLILTLSVYYQVLDN